MDHAFRQKAKIYIVQHHGRFLGNTIFGGDFVSNMQYSPDMQQYFNTLPGIVQETIKQSNQNISSLEDLKKCAENLMKKM